MLNRRRRALDSSLMPRSRSLAVAMRLKPAHGGDLGVELGDRQHLLRQDRDERVLDLRGHARQLLDAHQAAGAHRPVHRARHQRRLARPLGEQAGVVPAVAQRLLGGARRALHEQRRVAADGGGEVLADPRLGRARHAEQQERPVGGERGDGDLDEPAGADVLRRDRRAVRQHAAEQVGDDGPRREVPVGRPRAVVVGRQRRQLAGELVLGVRAQDLASRQLLQHRAYGWPPDRPGGGPARSPATSRRTTRAPSPSPRSSSRRIRATKLISTARWGRPNEPSSRPAASGVGGRAAPRRRAGRARAGGTASPGSSRADRRSSGRGRRRGRAGGRPARAPADRRVGATRARRAASPRWRRSSPTSTSGGSRQPPAATASSHSSSRTGHDADQRPPPGRGGDRQHRAGVGRAAAPASVPAPAAPARPGARRCRR